MTHQWPTPEQIADYVKDEFNHTGTKLDAAIAHVQGIYDSLIDNEQGVGETVDQAKARLLADPHFFTGQFLNVAFLTECECCRCDNCGYLVSLEAGSHERDSGFICGETKGWTAAREDRRANLIA